MGTKPAAPAFHEAAETYFASQEAGWRNEKHQAQWCHTNRDCANSKIEMKPIDEVTVDDITAILKAIWTDKFETASRLSF